MSTPSQPDEAICFDAVGFTPANGRPILRSVSLNIAAGERVALLGRSGAGKTTLLRSINRLTLISRGNVNVLAKPVTQWNVLELRKHCGYVLQDGGLFPHMTCRQNVQLPLRVAGKTAAEQKSRGDDVFQLVGLDPAIFGPRRPHELSGGQRQRVGVARALVTDPPILLMDEPFGALDPLTRREMQQMMVKIFEKDAKTAVMVTHDLEEALRLGTRIVLIEQGEVQLDLPAADFLYSPNELARQYVTASRGTLAAHNQMPSDLRPAQ